MALSTASSAVAHRLSFDPGDGRFPFPASWLDPTVAFAALLLWPVACRPAASAGRQPRSWTTRATRSRSRRPPRRVVSLIPATTELLFAIGAGSRRRRPHRLVRLSGRRRQRCPIWATASRPTSKPSSRSRPDLVILYNSAQNADIAARLRELGIAALRLNTDALGDVDRVGRLLGRLTGHAARRRLGGRGVRHRACAQRHRAARRRGGPRCCCSSGSSRR